MFKKVILFGCLLSFSGAFGVIESLTLLSRDNKKVLLIGDRHTNSNSHPSLLAVERIHDYFFLCLTVQLLKNKANSRFLIEQGLEVQWPYFSSLVRKSYNKLFIIDYKFADIRSDLLTWIHAGFSDYLIKLSSIAATGYDPYLYSQAYKEFAQYLEKSKIGYLRVKHIISGAKKITEAIINHNKDVPEACPGDPKYLIQSLKAHYKKLVAYLTKYGTETQMSQVFEDMQKLQSDELRAELKEFYQRMDNFSNMAFECDVILGTIKSLEYCDYIVIVTGNLHTINIGHVLTTIYKMQAGEYLGSKYFLRKIPYEPAIKTDDLFKFINLKYKLEASPAESSLQLAQVLYNSNMPYISPTCGWCKSKTDSLTRCSRCKSVYYCGRVCQSKHWVDGNHKKDCDETIRKNKINEI